MSNPSASYRQVGRWVQGDVCFSALVRTIDASNQVAAAFRIERLGEPQVPLEVLAPRFDTEAGALEHIRQHLSTFHGMSRAPL